MNRSKVLSLILLAILVIVLIAVKVFDLKILSIIAYFFFFIGIYTFFSSCLKQNKSGIIIGSAMFLFGSMFFVITKYELLNLGTIIVPAILAVVGMSFLIGNVLAKLDVLSIIFSTLCLFGGLWLIINRSDANLNLFLSAAYSIIKNYWLVLIGSAWIIFLTVKNFKKKD
ncbi:MAG: hypothetical protein WAR59_10245 [Ignavibacteriaceae bacterium]